MAFDELAAEGAGPFAGEVAALDGRHQRIDGEVLSQRALQILSMRPRPFLKWAGSKQRLLSDIIPALPTSFDRYYEPFVGSGALFFLLRPERASLGDACSPLIETYKAVANETDEVLKHLQRMDPLDKDMYYRVRKQKLRSTAKRAARFIYLNRSGFNGLYRVNQRGDFNVPYGSPGSATVVDQANLYACADRLSAAGVEIKVGDFEEAVSSASRGDLVFFDPPYVTGHNNNGFVDYNEKLFSWADQERLALVASKLQEKGVHVIISNAHHDAVIELYPGFQLQAIERFSTLAGKKSARRIVKEALFFG